MSVEPLAVKSGKLKLGATGTCKGTHSWVWREAEIQACASGKGYKSERKPPPTRQEGRDNAQTDCRGLLSPSPETQGPGVDRSPLLGGLRLGAAEQTAVPHQLTQNPH